MDAESELILKTARRLREREFKIKKKVRAEGYTPWDADRDMFKWRGYKLENTELPIRRVVLDGRVEVSLVGEKNEKSNLVFLFTDYVALSRLRGSALDYILNAAKILDPKRLFISKGDGSAIEAVQYCLEMDEVIQKMTRFMRERQVKDFYSKILGVIGDKDELGRRIQDLKALVDHYKFDKAGWRPEIERLGLIG